MKKIITFILLFTSLGLHAEYKDIKISTALEGLKMIQKKSFSNLDLRDLKYAVAEGKSVFYEKEFPSKKGLTRVFFRWNK